ncbi:MAG TPA: hypothetical protein VMZ28_17605 [Kofleriaceae bacterium]|nr:hypothetical protein [Kofleriaceae bacterium]
MRRWIVGVGLCAMAVLAIVLAPGRAPAVAPPAPPLWLVLIATSATASGPASESGLHLVELTGGRLPPAVARFAHLPDGAVRGALLPGSDAVLVVADRQQLAPVRDGSFAGVLLRVEPGQGARPLCDRVDHASRPLVALGGRVFVGRGRPGPALPGAMRVDALSIDEIDPVTGVEREVWRGRGFHASLAGAHGTELFIYQVTAGGASLLAVDPDSGATRTVLPSLLPFARDFVVSEGVLTFATRDEARADRWVIDRVELASGTRRRLLTAPGQHLAPHPWPGGDLAFDPGDGRGLRLLSGGRPELAGLGAGADVVRAIAPEAARAALWHYVPGATHAEVRIVDARRGESRAVTASPATRLEIVGFSSDFRSWR